MATKKQSKQQAKFKATIKVAKNIYKKGGSWKAAIKKAFKK
jgi:hypothetical protein